MRKSYFDAGVPGIFIDLDTGFLWAPNLPRTLQRDIADVTVSNTVTATDIFSCNVDHNDINNRALSLEIAGTFLFNSGSAKDNTIVDVRLNSVTLQSVTFQPVSLTATPYVWWMKLLLISRSTSAQRLTGISQLGVGTTPNLLFNASGTVDTTGEGTKTLAVRATHSSASANLSITKVNACLLSE